MSVTFTTPAADLSTLVIHGRDADVEVRTTEGLDEARIEIFGPDHIIDAVTADRLGAQWLLDLPQTSSTTSTFHSSSGTSFVANNTGGMVIQAGHVSGGIFMNGSGNITVGGRLGSTHIVTPDPQVRVRVHLPQNTSLSVELTSGSLTATQARLGSVTHSSSSGDVTLGHVQELTARTSYGSVVVHRVHGRLASVRTSSGQIILDGGTTVSLRSSSGSISYTATGDCSVSARASSGSITIRRGGHQVQTQVRTSSGRVWDH